MKKSEKPSNRWNNIKNLKHKGFVHGSDLLQTGLGMSPSENYAETLVAGIITENFNKKKKKLHHAIAHSRIDNKGLRTPDISFFNIGKGIRNQNESPVIIELDSFDKKNYAIGLCRKTIGKHGVNEAFVLLVPDDLTKEFQWIKVEKKTCLPNVSISAILNIDLNTLLKFPKIL